jgi:hypothetical protein
MMIPQFTLPNDHTRKIALREATVEDLIDFAEIDPQMEELATTQFLTRLQAKDAFSDPADWSADSRRFALFWYWLHTSTDVDIPLSYDCTHCGEKHTFLQDGRALANEYNSSSKSTVEIVFDKKKVTVRPHNGRDMELSEGERLEIAMGKDEGHKRKLTARMRFLYYSRVMQIEGMEEAGKEAYLHRLNVTDFKVLAAKVNGALESLSHGLNSTIIEGRIYLLTPAHECPNRKGVTTRIRVFFRPLDYIPQL